VQWFCEFVTACFAPDPAPNGGVPWLAADPAPGGTKLGWYWSRSMTLGRFAVMFFIGLVASIAFKLIWLYWLLAAALLAVLVKLRLNG